MITWLQKPGWLQRVVTADRVTWRGIEQTAFPQHDSIYQLQLAPARDWSLFLV